MQRVVLSGSNMHEAVKKAAEVLRFGGVILYPTDTLYGLGADAFDDAAVDRVYAIKGRDEKKPIHCIVADLTMAEEYAEIGNDARLLMARFLPGALTLILPAKGGPASGGKKRTGIARDIATVGIRIPDNEFCLALARAFGKPFTATSANRAGLAAPFSIEEILEQLGGEKAGIDLVVDAARLPPCAPSTIVDLSGEEPIILREGALPVEDIWNTIKVAD